MVKIDKAKLKQKLTKKPNATAKPIKPNTQKPLPSVKLEHGKSLSSLQQKMQQKLSGSKFRWINEQLYSSKSKDAMDMFNQTPEYFKIYHEGFRNQVEKWPVNPVDLFINEFNRIKDDVVIADMGCGDAKLSQVLSKKPNMTVHSFDLISNNKIVIACDIRSVPLKSGSVDIVVFCLSLMGTNYLEFIAEANRILKIGGKLKIAEVQSRITQSDGDTGVQSFVDSLGALGFKVSKKWDGSNKVFILFEFIKDKNAVKQGEGGNERRKGAIKQQRAI